MSDQKIFIPHKKDENDESCAVCELYSDAEKELKPKYLCPNCGHELILDPYECEIEDNWKPIGLDNGLQPQMIKMRPVLQCDCGQKYTFDLVPVIWNANHDIYYTGDGQYIAVGKQELTKELQNAITGAVDQFLSRTAKGEQGLSAWNLAYWIQGDVEELVAKLLPAMGWRIK